MARKVGDGSIGAVRVKVGQPVSERIRQECQVTSGSVVDGLLESRVEGHDRRRGQGSDSRVQGACREGSRRVSTKGAEGEPAGGALGIQQRLEQGRPIEGIAGARAECAAGAAQDARVCVEADAVANEGECGIGVRQRRGQRGHVPISGRQGIDRGGRGIDDGGQVDHLGWRRGRVDHGDRAACRKRDSIRHGEEGIALCMDRDPGPGAGHDQQRQQCETCDPRSTVRDHLTTSDIRRLRCGA